MLCLLYFSSVDLVSFVQLLPFAESRNSPGLPVLRDVAPLFITHTSLELESRFRCDENYIMHRYFGCIHK